MTRTADAPAREDLLAEVVRWDAEITRWTAEALANRDAAQSLRARVGDGLLADASSGSSTTSKVRELEDGAGAAESAASAAEGRLKQAWRAVLAHDAQRWDAEAERLEAKLLEHRTKTDRLLGQLRKHEGEFAPRQELMRGENTYLVPVPVKSSELEQDVQQARLKALVLRDILAGHNPRATAYPGDPGPDGRVLKLADQRTGLVLGLAPSEYFPDMSIPEVVAPELGALTGAPDQA